MSRFVDLGGEVVYGDKEYWLNITTELGNVTLERYISSEVYGEDLYMAKVIGYEYVFKITKGQYSELKYLMTMNDTLVRLEDFEEQNKKILEEISWCRSHLSNISDHVE